MEQSVTTVMKTSHALILVRFKAHVSDLFSAFRGDGVSNEAIEANNAPFNVISFENVMSLGSSH